MTLGLPGIKWAGLGLAVVMLSGCAGQQLQMASSTEASGSKYMQHLYKRYVALSKAEYAEGDYKDSDSFANRAIASATGNPPDPEAMSARMIPAEHKGALVSARRQLTEAMAGGSAVRDGINTARAQAAFDCWMQEQEENIQPKDVKVCAVEFKRAMTAMKPVPTMKKKPTKVAFKQVPVSDPPKMMDKKFANYTVYFANNSAVIDDGGLDTIDDAAATVLSMVAKKIIVSGYTDRVGSAGANKRLAKQRAENVAAALSDASLFDIAKKITIVVHGEAKNKVLTADGIAERRNRRVRIEVKK